MRRAKGFVRILHGMCHPCGVRREGTHKLATLSLLAEAPSVRVSIVALFDGQGISEIYFDELQTPVDTYRPFVEPSLASSSTRFFNHLLPLPSVLFL
jgi:hypothetical protein